MIDRNSFTRLARIENSVSKRAVLTLALLGLLAATSVGPAAAQLSNSQPRFHIPFAFTANGKRLPAGEYKLDKVEPKVLSLQSVDGEGGVLLPTQADYPAGSEISARSALVFDNYFGREYALSTVRAGDIHFDVVPMHHEERVARRATREVTIVAERMP